MNERMNNDTYMYILLRFWNAYRKQGKTCTRLTYIGSNIETYYLSSDDVHHFHVTYCAISINWRICSVAYDTVSLLLRVAHSVSADSLGAGCLEVRSNYSEENQASIWCNSACISNADIFTLTERTSASPSDRKKSRTLKHFVRHDGRQNNT